MLGFCECPLAKHRMRMGRYRPRAFPTPLCEGEDLVAEWKRRCPLEKICTGELKGTTTRFLKKAVDDNEGDIANRLRNYYKLALMCQELTKDRLPRLPAGELGAIVAKLEGEFTFPDIVKGGLTDHAIQRQVDALDFVGLLRTITPWGNEDATFDPRSPTVCAMTWPMPKKVEKYKAALFGKLIPSLIGGGEPRARVLHTLCAHIIKEYDAVDSVELGSLCVSLWADTLKAVRALAALISYEFSPAIDALLEIAKNRGKTSKALIVRVAAAIEASDYYSERLNNFVCNESLVVEWANKVEDHNSFLESEPVPSIEAFKTCDVVLKDLGTFIAALPMKMLSSFTTPFEALVVSLACEVAKMPADKVDRSLALVASRSVSEAISVFPMNSQLGDVQNELATLLVKLDSGDRVDSALKVFRSALDLSSTATCVEESTKLCGALKNCAALDLPDELTALLSSRAMELVGYMCVHCADVDAIDDHKTILDCLSQLGQRIANPAIGVAQSLVEAGVNLAEQWKVASGLKDVGDDDDDAASEVVTALRVRIEQLKASRSPRSAVRTWASHSRHWMRSSRSATSSPRTTTASS